MICKSDVGERNEVSKGRIFDASAGVFVDKKFESDSRHVCFHSAIFDVFVSRECKNLERGPS
jgi:hypothetical protein